MRDLSRLFRPKSIAVIGGGAWGANVIDQCRRIGFTGDLWAVHPERDTLGGVRAYPSIAELPDAPDAAYVAVNRVLSVDAVARLSRLGAGGAICFASGFREAEKEDGGSGMLQDALLEAAGDMPIIGPNCYGMLNYLDGVALWPDQHGGKRNGSGVAVVAQSSNIAINLTMQRRGLPLAYMVTVGNQAQTGIADIGVTVLRDPRVTALGLYVEGVGGLRGVEALAAEARRLGKRVVALKIGASDQARAATVSHTASLAGSDAGARALFTRLGIGQVTSLSAFLETLKILHVAGPLASSRIASMSCSGGEAGLMADAVQGTALRFPPLLPRQEKALRAVLGPMVALANPLDYHTYIWADGDAMARTFAAMTDPKADIGLGIVVLDFPRADRCCPDDWDLVVDAAARAQVRAGRPVAVLATLGETMPEAVAERLTDRGLVPLAGVTEAIEAIGVAAGLGRAFDPPEPLLLPRESGPAPALSEAVAKSALAEHGLTIPASRRAASPEEAAVAAERIGFPVVLKGEGIAHKTEAGAVALNLTSARAVAAAARAMPCGRFLIEEMITGSVAELLVGVVCDPAHGYVLTLAAGGTLTEILEDSATLLVPARRDDVLRALDTLRLARIIGGYRGGPAASRDAIADAVMAVQDFVAARKPREVEINPLLCGPERAVAADALVTIGGTDGEEPN